jgi:hypothetical protein
MSFRRPRVSRRNSSQSSSRSDPIHSSQPYLIAPSDAPSQRKPPNTSHLPSLGWEPLLALPGGLTYTHLHQPDPRSAIPQEPFTALAEEAWANDPGSDFLIEPPEPESSQDRADREWRKKERQWQRWTTEVIPALLQPYLRLLRQSKSLRTVEQHPFPPCPCDNTKRQLNIICIFFSSTLILRHHRSYILGMRRTRTDNHSYLPLSPCTRAAVDAGPLSLRPNCAFPGC